MCYSQYKRQSLLGAFLALFVNATVAQGVKLTVEIETYDWGSNREGKSLIKCIVETNNWRIAGDLLMNAYEGWWFTGTNLLCTDLITGRKMSETQGIDLRGKEQNPVFYEQRTTTFKSADGNPGMNKDQSDLLSTPSARICWLALCSGSYLRREVRTIFPPDELWKEFMNAPSGFSVRAKVFEDDLRLPESLDLVATNLQPVLQYRVSSWTNFAGFHIPLKFALVQYVPVNLSASERWWQVFFTAKGNVTQLELSRTNETLLDLIRDVKAPK